jgi:seryl-tRNA synthetase
MVEESGSTEPQQRFRDQLFAEGILLPSGVAGVVGWSEEFGRLIDAINRFISKAARRESAVRTTFPPLMPRAQLEKMGYLASFPHLAGTVFAFAGSEEDAAKLGDLVASERDWSHTQTMTDIVLTPAACYPVYPAVASRGEIPAGGLTVDTGGAYVFRHEPSPDPARQQMFHMRELVRFDTPEQVVLWRNRWRDRALEMIASLDLSPKRSLASDPFFGRGGRLLARSQRAQSLKYEIRVDIGGEEPTAVASFNYHQDHFSSLYGLKIKSGDEPAHTACLGFGLERIALALMWRHGLRADGWPIAVRKELDLA